MKIGFEPALRVPVPPDAPTGGDALEPPSPFQELKGQRVVLKFAGRYLSLPQQFYDEIEAVMERVDGGEGKIR